MTVYRPDRWVVLEILGDGERVLKVLGGWCGGYTQGDGWRLNSGIVGVVDKGDMWEVRGSSGSVYECVKEAEQFGCGLHAVYEAWKRGAEEDGRDLAVRLVSMESVVEEMGHE